MSSAVCGGSVGQSRQAFAQSSALVLVSFCGGEDALLICFPTLWKTTDRSSCCGRLWYAILPHDGLDCVTPGARMAAEAAQHTVHPHMWVC